MNPSVWFAYGRFCAVGLVGAAVDTTLLGALHEAAELDVRLAKVVSAEVALVGNFFLNEAWTFRGQCGGKCGKAGRFARFHAICLTGMAMSVVILWMLHTQGGLPVVASNGVAIVLVSMWNFTLSRRFGWAQG